MKKFTVAAVMLAFSVPALAEPLTVDQVVALSASGIGDDAIVAKIKSSASTFDLSPEQMIALKARGVSGPVIAAMLAGGGRAALISVDSPDPSIPHAAGVYLLADWEASPKMQRIDATVSSQAKTGGIFGYALTGGIASMSMKTAIQNETARAHSPKGKPVFYFFFDESNPSDGRIVATWSAGPGAAISSPNEFTLVRLTAKSGRREARVGSMNIGGAKFGVMDKDRIPFEYKMVRPGVYEVTPTAALPKGEYGFLYAMGGAAVGGALTARIFDFAVD